MHQQITTARTWLAAWLRRVALWLDPPIYIPTRQVLVSKPSQQER